MINFSAPLWLFLLCVPALLMVWVWTRQTGRIAFPLDHSELPPSRFWLNVLRLVESLPVLLLAVVILILAGPQRMGVPQAKRSLTNIQFCVDVSGSMTAKFGDATRYDKAMEAINGFLDYREGDAFGLTFFGNAVVHWVPLTTDSSALKCAPPFMHPSNPNRSDWFQGTEVGKALLACQEVLSARSEGDRLIVLISDGQSADLANGQAEAIGKLLRDSNIVVYDIHVAEEDTPAEIATIAMLTGGEVYHPGDPETLAEVFQQIDKMEPAEIERTVGQPLDNFQPYCLVALCLSGLFQMSLFGWRYTPW
ncbi:vWA domain-containing protein [Bremerella sp. JC817]|uniref:vWA domain-containing protein n=1 Tax=Bremerella sp. JC817 TaxID=3231756 RepID=UPI0034584667